MLSLRGKRCLITGGSRGIGLGIAKLLACEGARCTLIGRHEESLTTAMKSLKQTDQSLPHDFRAFDVSAPNGWQLLMSDLKNERVDVLVNAAGVSHNTLLFKMSYPEIDRILDINLKGTILGCQGVVTKMMKQRSGCIINISSLLATHGGRGASVYAATKAGVIGLTRSLALEVGRFNIRANVIQPGYIQTDMTQAMDENGNLAPLIPLGRLGTVEEVADAALFLANNSYAHNCVLNIDGGLSAT
ncbi:putative 3-oxoacyl-acyl carrier protein reductase [Rosellinia necatrix]|uniref:Putative 3-oxoacyl-acyl carrier protein reductase n=1 Tax=Rosellinia necatrix TaxID=77044 RepID=A0A1W2TRD7_ROSNE|nr:putative 3-oxoacyl-acyl carrier protein reductase [Rosellinia necatrix]